ncbi:MAG: hypothetical protein HN576_12715 [Bacteriovoracaceae bacterium]|jgi:hypothetical protein|nr:hypothetical protein [Bacteriovoracaceae bacterium]
MLARKDQESKGQKLPIQFEEKVQKLLIENYKSQFDGSLYTFEVHGFSYPNEVVMTASLVNIQDELLAPTTYHVSANLNENIKMDQLLNDLVDSMGIFFDNYFSTSDWNDFQAGWEEIKYKKLTLFYKVTRENISASLYADQILEQDQ